jgi:hypothetical protein
MLMNRCNDNVDLDDYCYYCDVLKSTHQYNLFVLYQNRFMSLSTEKRVLLETPTVADKVC